MITTTTKKNDLKILRSWKHRTVISVSNDFYNKITDDYINGEKYFNDAVSHVFCKHKKDLNDMKTLVKQYKKEWIL